MDIKEVNSLVQIISNQKNLPEDKIFEAIEKSFATGIRKKFPKGTNLKFNIDRETGEETLFVEKTVVDDNFEGFDPNVNLYEDQAQEIGDYKIGDVVLIPVEEPEGGRTAASISKQILTQEIDAAEKEVKIEEFKNKIGELRSFKVVRFEKGSAIVEYDENIEAILPKSEMVGNERLKIGSTFFAVVAGVSNSRVFRPLLSRRNKEFFKAILRMEVPEISNDDVEIISVARIPGYMSVAIVDSWDRRAYNPEAVCIGSRGLRINRIREDLGGERVEVYANEKDSIDIISKIIKQTPTKAVLEEDNTLKLYFEGNDYKEIKKKRLDEILNQLLEENIVILEGDGDNKEQEMIDYFCESLNVDDDFALALFYAGFSDVEDIINSNESDFYSIDGVDNSIVAQLRDNAKEYVLTHPENNVSPVYKALYELGFPREDAKELYIHDIETAEDLADLSIDEVVDLIPRTTLTKEQIGEIIMKARGIDS